jgi:hypothetical protein
LFAIFAGLFHQKCNLLKARVIIYAYHHVRLLPPEPLVVKQPKFTQVEGTDTVMQSSGLCLARCIQNLQFASTAVFGNHIYLEP